MTPRTAICPQCGEPAVIGPGNPDRPFCSERCRLIDLGDWLSGNHRLPSDEPVDIEDLPDDDVTRH